MRCNPDSADGGATQVSDGLAESAEFSVSVDRSARPAIATVAGELDLATADRFVAAISEALIAGPVLLDLAGLTFMDSSGVRALDDLLREVERERWTLSIRSLFAPNVRQVMEITGMLDALPFEATSAAVPADTSRADRAE
jgi:anti-sigma B factor antagonist